MHDSPIHHRVFRGWRKIAQTIAAPFLAISAIVLISGGIVLPLWFLATRAPAAYGLSVLAGSFFAGAIWIFHRLKGRTRDRRHGRRRSGTVWIAAIVSAAGLYATGLIYTSVGIIAAVPMLLLVVAAVGYAAGGRTGYRD